jgi:hypothetical protein
MATPGPNDWDTSKLPEWRRAYLDNGRSFESIAALIVEQSEITKYWPEPLRDKPSKDFPSLTKSASACVLERKPSICFTMHPTAFADDTGKLQTSAT